MESLTLEFEGDADLLMHNNRTVNPFDPITQMMKAYTSKKKKTEDDIKSIMRLEWEAGLYHDTEVGPYIPAVNVEICLRDAAKINRQGVNITRGVVVTSDKLPLEYDGPRGTGSAGIHELYEANLKDYRVVGNQKNSIMRCRPKFPAGWKVTVPISFEQSVINRDDLLDIAERAGMLIGLGDYRPRFGRFTVEEV
jgi:hypothetical protein